MKLIKTVKLLACLSMLFISVGSCANKEPKNKPEETKKWGNPFSIYCNEHDGKEVTRKDTKGSDFGVCVFKNPPSECDSVEYMNNNCKPGDCKSINAKKECVK